MWSPLMSNQISTWLSMLLCPCTITY
jgi:hypothetical protein